MRQVVGGLAAIVAIQYLLIAVFIVPRLSAFAESRSRYITAAKWGAIAFFVGCAATHVGIANELILGTHTSTSSNSHLTVHLVPHLAQVIGGITFIVIAHRHLVVSVVPRDVARRLHDAEDRLKLALDASGLGTWELDLSTRELLVQFDMAGRRAQPNDRAAIGSVARPTTVAWTADRVLEIIHPDDRPIVEEQTRRALETERLEFEVRLVTQPGQPARWIAATGRLYRDGSGAPARVVGTVADTTEHRMSELERTSLERRLQHAQRVDAIGRLAGGVAHDFNNLLQVINGYVELVQQSAGDCDVRTFQAELDAIADAGRRGATLTNQLLAFSRDATSEAVSVNINEAVGGAVTLIQRLIGDDIRVVVSLSDGAGHVVIDPHQIGQVIMNLGLNARDAMPHGGLLTIETIPVDLDEHAPLLAEGLAPGRYTMVAVSDTGVGMPPDVRDRLFEPFFTTKDGDAGTGLGLPIVYGIVRRAGGHVTVYSEPREGAVFKVYLPRHDLSPTSPDSSAPAYALGDARVLVVEDEPGVRELLTNMLGRLGYAVTSIASPEEAMAIDHIDHHLLVADVMMPSMSGPQLAQRLRARKPNLKVLFISGYTGTAMTERSILRSDDAFLPKPFTMSALAERVGALLGTTDDNDHNGQNDQSTGASSTAIAP